MDHYLVILCKNCKKALANFEHNVIMKKDTEIPIYR